MTSITVAIIWAETSHLGMPARNAMDFLSFIGEGESAQGKNPRRRPQARGRGSSERLDVLSLIGEGEEQPPHPRN